MGELLVKGLIIGLIFGVPAGAIGALSVQRTIEKGFLTGFVTGLGSSAADALYACLGVFGITMITDFLQRNQRPISIAGSVIIAVYGVSILRKKERPGADAGAGAGNRFSGFLSAFLIAIMNPATILSFFLAFSAFGIVGDYSILQGLSLILGVVLGTGIWWGILNGAVHCFKKRINDKVYHGLNVTLGMLMILFSGVLMVRNLRRRF